MVHRCIYRIKYQYAENFIKRGRKEEGERSGGGESVRERVWGGKKRGRRKEGRMEVGRKGKRKEGKFCPLCKIKPRRNASLGQMERKPALPSS